MKLKEEVERQKLEIKEKDVITKALLKWTWIKLTKWKVMGKGSARK